MPKRESTDSYKRLADVFHDLLAEQSLEALLERIGAALAELVLYEEMTIYEVDEPSRTLVPILARSTWRNEVMRSRPAFGEGLTGWAVEHGEAILANDAHRDPRVVTVPGTPVEPEALIVVPLIARGAIKGTLNIYRLGEEARFEEAEFELACRFADAAALALDNARIRARLEHQAQTDSLTGLYNHRHFHERLQAELGRVGRTGDSVAVLMVDLDDFKRVNDVYGHGEGDSALVGFAELLRSLVRTADVVCRLGGEEFGVVLPSSTALDAVVLAERLRDRLTRTALSPDGPLQVSIGVAEGPAHAMNARELAACAESSMMTAKAAGGDSVVTFAADASSRPDGPSAGRDARSIAHLKMLQSLAGKLNRLNDVTAIGNAIVTELRALVDYHNCRVVIVDGNDLRPVAVHGDLGNPELGPDAVACRVGDGITGRVAATGASLLVPDVRACDFSLTLPGTEPVAETIAAVPLRYGARVIGVIVISKLGVNQLDGDDIRLLEVLAGHASVALENARLYDEQRLAAERASESAEIAEALLRFSRDLVWSGGLDATADRLVAAARTLFGARFALMLLEDGDGALTMLATAGEHAPGHRVALAGEVARRFLIHGGPSELAAEELAELGLEATSETTYYAAPVEVEDRLGCLILALQAGVERRERRLRLLAGVADQGALALSSAGSWETLERMFVSTVEVLANALGAADQNCSSDTRWICDAALAVGHDLRIDPERLRRLEYAALFHDIGKIGVPHDVLLKPGPLTAEERALVERHPEIGERILGPVERLSKVARIVRACHERWDGTGYPDRLAGESIPLEARIIFVCDAYQAMVTDRPYRAAFTDAEARHRLHESAGTQFDPRVVESFLGLDLDSASEAAA